MTANICVKDINNSIMELYDVLILLKYSSRVPVDIIDDFCDYVKIVRDDCKEGLDVPLIALKEYVEGHLSWERACMLCDLNNNGLIDYCESKGVDYRNLRFDDYYDCEDMELIKEEWSKLDPTGLLSPINLTGGFEFKSPREYSYDSMLQSFYTNKGRFLVSEFGVNLQKFLLNSKTISFDNVEDDLKFLDNLCTGLVLNTEVQCLRLVEILDECKKILTDKGLVECIDFLKSHIVDNYYYFSI